MAAFNFSPDGVLRQIPAMSGLLPFLLLIMVTLRLPIPDPSPIFGVGLLLAVLLLGMTRRLDLESLPAFALAGVLALEHAWHFKHFGPAFAVIPLAWYAGFALLFLAFPFVALRDRTETITPWIVSALSGVLHFFLVHHVITLAWPNHIMGLLPVAFAVPVFGGLAYLVRSLPAEAPKRLTLLAWFGGVALFFVTLIFPLQFDRQWITVGWALEGTALLWLFHRVPHAGLQLTGVGLLAIAFFRLAANPAVLEYHVRSTTPIFNWYLYAYGLVIAALFAGVGLMAPPRNLVLRSDGRAILSTLGTILLFWLVNIEIADYFSDPGSRSLRFEFSGNFARDMSYSIAWALFALGLLVVGMAKQLKAPRYAGIVLLSITLLKLFFHDLARLDQLYRIGAFLGVAIIAIAASFLYQRFAKLNRS